MALNLVQHRCEESIWDRQPAAEWDTERWLMALMSGALLVASLRRRSLTGLALAIGGAGLAWWAARGIEERQARRAKLTQVWPLGRAGGDLVTESSEESFPASDAPSWTPTTGNM